MGLKKQSKHHKKIGQIPGTITYTGEKNNPLNIEIFNYNIKEVSEYNLKTYEELTQIKTSDSITWTNINSLNETLELEKIGKYYKIHHLIVEDIVNISQRPKLEVHEDYIFIVLRMLYYDKDNMLKSEQVSFILGDNYVLTFQEAEGDVFENVRERLRHGMGRIRTQGSDYLLYSLIDSITDHYYTIIETIGDKIENIEDHLFSGETKQEIPLIIQNLKKEILKIRKAIFPLREIINKIEKTENSYIQSKTLVYFRDVYDHVIQVSENIEIYREMIWGLMDMHMTAISNKMNEVMKVLTIIATIFIPLTFIAGIYGMNFENMPELHYKYGYLIVWLVMIVLFVFMLFYFKRKKWL